MIGVKTCLVCGPRPRRAFSPDRRSRDGLRNTCRRCVAARVREAISRPTLTQRIEHVADVVAQSELPLAVYFDKFGAVRTAARDTSAYRSAVRPNNVDRLVGVFDMHMPRPALLAAIDEAARELGIG